MIQKVMERIVRQEITAVAIDNADVLWCPETNEVRPYPESGSAPAKPPSAEREPDFGKGFEAMARQGRLAPDAGAVGAPISAEEFLTEARQALEALP